MAEKAQFEFTFPATVVAQAGGSFLVTPGKPVAREMLRVPEVAKKLQVTEQHVLDLIDEGQIEAVNIGGGERKYWRVRVETLGEFLTKRSSLAGI